MEKRSEELPLSGITVLVTRTMEQSSEVVRNLTARGAEVKVVPVLSIVPLPEPEGLDRAITRIDSYDHIVLTSVNAVNIALELMSEAGLKPGDIPSALCVGDKTARAWKDKGGEVAFVPERYTAQALLDTLGKDLAGSSYLIMRPEVVKTELGREMSSRGAIVDEVVIYRTVLPEEGKEDLVELLADGGPDVIFFASPSAVEGILKMSARPSTGLGAGSTQHAARSILDVPAVCIGPTTARAAGEAGFTQVYFPDEHTAEGMVDELMVIAERVKKPKAQRPKPKV